MAGGVEVTAAVAAACREVRQEVAKVGNQCLVGVTTNVPSSAPQPIWPQMAKVSIRCLVGVTTKVACEGLPGGHEPHVGVHVRFAAGTPHWPQLPQVHHLCVCVCASVHAAK
eukprot:scaffold263011_cov21-Tisochrysis_lutea.AAC.1